MEARNKTASEARFLVFTRNGDAATGMICDGMQYFSFWDDEDIEAVPLQALADQWLRNRKRHEKFLEAVGK